MLFLRTVLISSLYSWMKEVLSHGKWLRRVIHGTRGMVPKIKLHLAHNFILSEP